MSSICYANPDSWPSITIIVNNAPSDLKITFGDKAEGRKRKIGMETQVSFYSGELQSEQGYKISVTANGQDTEYTIEVPLEYRNIYTLDLKNQTLTNGKTPLRYIRLVIIYVLLTLILEGFIFYLFGFRKKRSWIAFVIINLITQVLLHIWTDSPNLFDSLWGAADDLVFSLVLGEFFVFVFEIIAFMITVKEKGIAKRIIYALAANSFSLVLGWFILSFIPV